jgi:hypothetical protein
LLALPSALSFGQAASETQLKALFLVNFMKYMEWPGTNAEVTLCVFGRSDIDTYLAAYEGRSIAGRNLRIRKVNALENLADCQELYVPAAEEARIGTILRGTDKLPILTISDTESFAIDGGAIALIPSEGRLQFDINYGTLLRAGLKPSSQLMRLARQVIGAPR